MSMTNLSMMSENDNSTVLTEYKGLNRERGCVMQPLFCYLPHFHLVEEEPGGIAYAVVPIRTHTQGFNFYFDITSLHWLVGCRASLDELNLHVAVLWELVRAEGTERLVIVRYGVGHAFGEQYPCA